MAGHWEALVVDDDEALRAVTVEALRREGWLVSEAAVGAQVASWAREHPFRLIVLDQRLPDADGVEILEDLRHEGYQGAAVVMTGYPTVQKAIEALGSAATDYLCKPVSPRELQRISRDARERDIPPQNWEFLWASLRKRYGFSNILGSNAQARHCYTTAARVAASRASVLIEGETGTGKEYLARAIHYMSERRDGPFVGINCGAIPEALLESELFGHEKGAFTSATTSKKGICELADGGTLLLDEVGELSPGAQVKLLRFLEERRLTRLGGLKPTEVDVRVLAATNRDLTRCMAEGTFREDLYYRLAVVPLTLPPLRERREDIACFARHFLKLARREAAGAGPADFSELALGELTGHDWPGNLRELNNVVHRAALLAHGSTLQATDIQICPRTPGTNKALAA